MYVMSIYHTQECKAIERPKIKCKNIIMLKVLKLVFINNVTLKVFAN